MIEEKTAEGDEIKIEDQAGTADDLNAEKGEAGEERETGDENAPEGEEETGPDGDSGEDGEEGAEEKATEEDESLNEKYMRLMADFQNFRRRVDKEKSDTYAYANEKIVTQLLEVMDNFERALEHECSDSAYAEGMDMIFKQLSAVLERSGLSEINALGEDFDPNFHNAVLMEDNEEFESGKVTSVMQKGYTLNGKVIRPAMVKVNN